jgi:glycosyltransferase involved in cell wall biosynthesis
VLHIITSLERGGAQTSVSDIVVGLRARGLDAQIAFSSNGGTAPGTHRALAAELVERGVPLRDAPEMRRGPSLRDPYALIQLERLIRRFHPTVVHTHASKAGVLGRIAAARAGVPVIIHSVRGWSWQGFTGMRRSLFVHVERQAAKVTHHFVAVAQAMVDEGVSRAVADPGRFTVIRSGIDLQRFARGFDRRTIRRNLGFGDDAQVVGTVTRFAPPKAPLDFVATAALVAARFPRARFLIVGDGAMRAGVEKAIRRARLASRVILLGERQDIPELLAAMDTFVLTSRWEGLPRVVVEAVAAGVPVVTTDVGGAREVVDHGRTGLVCDPGRIDRLAELVGITLDDPAGASRMADAARASLPASVDLPSVIDGHVALYQRLTSAPFRHIA